MLKLNVDQIIICVTISLAGNLFHAYLFWYEMANSIAFNIEPVDYLFVTIVGEVLSVIFMGPLILFYRVFLSHIKQRRKYIAMSLSIVLYSILIFFLFWKYMGSGDLDGIFAFMGCFCLTTLIIFGLYFRWSSQNTDRLESNKKMDSVS